MKRNIFLGVFLLCLNFVYGSGITNGIVSGSGSGNVVSINSDTTAVQTIAVGSSGTDFAIVDDAAGTHTLNLPNASATARGLVSTGAQTLAGQKTLSSAPILSSLTATTVPYLDASKVLVSSAVTPTQLSYVDFSSSGQTQLNAKAPLASPTFSGTIGTALTSSRVVTTDGSGNLAAASTTTTVLGYLDVGSSLTTLLAAKQGLDTQLTSLAALSYGSNALKVVRVNAGETDFELATASGGVTTPGTTIATDLVRWNSTTGAAVDDGGVKLRTVGSGTTINFQIGNAGGLATTTGTGNTIVGNSSQTVDTGASNNALFGTNLAAVGTVGEAVAMGANAGNGATGSDDYSVSVGSGAGNAGKNSINLGYKAGRYDNTVNVLYIDGLDRTNQSGNQTKSIIYGVMNSTVASQTLKFNAVVTLGPTSATPKHVINGETKTDGAQLGTLTHSPTAGDPAGYWTVTFDGTTSYIPYWQ